MSDLRMIDQSRLRWVKLVLGKVDMFKKSESSQVNESIQCAGNRQMSLVSQDVLVLAPK